MNMTPASRENLLRALELAAALNKFGGHWTIDNREMLSAVCILLGTIIGTQATNEIVLDDMLRRASNSVESVANEVYYKGSLSV